MKISIGADHRGYELKQALIHHFNHITWLDIGTDNADERVDYPVFSRRVCKDILGNKAERGILLCGSGVGMAIAANRYKGIYAALCWDKEIARVAREDDGSNVLVLPADFIDAEQAYKIVQAWFSAEFKQGHYQDRLTMLDEMS